MSKIPNLFDYATSELSQDAFICWLISWSDSSLKEQDRYLNDCASLFVKELLNKSLDFEIISVEVGRQWNNIDVWALINDKYFIVIEDKKGTVEHSNQLIRYSESARKHYNKTDIEIQLVYFKMQEQGQYSKVKEAGFFLFGREKMLSLLNPYIEKTKTIKTNDILFDYYKNLENLDKKINSYKNIPIEKWYWHSWIGFYSELQKQLGGKWDYVANASGGFLGFWWHWHFAIHKENDFEFYLQLEENQLVFKLSCDNTDSRNEIRDYFRRKLYPKAKKLNIEIHQFGRIGQWMGVARLNENYRKTDSQGIIDMNLTIERLKNIQLLMDELDNELKE